MITKTNPFYLGQEQQQQNLLVFVVIIELMVSFSYFSVKKPLLALRSCLARFVYHSRLFTNTELIENLIRCFSGLPKASHRVLITNY